MNQFAGRVRGHREHDLQFPFIACTYDITRGLHNRLWQVEILIVFGDQRLYYHLCTRILVRHVLSGSAWSGRMRFSVRHVLGLLVTGVGGLKGNFSRQRQLK